MLKKMLFIFLILTVVLVLFIPATSLASGPEPQPKASGNTPRSTSAYETKSIKDAEEAADDSPGETDGIISAMSLSSVGPAKYTKTMKYYDPELDCLWTSYSYTAPKTGMYTFHCLNDFDTDIYITRAGSDVAYEESDMPFTLCPYLVKDKTYTITLLDWEWYGSTTYLTTTPATLGTAAYKMKSNGYAYDWYQAFDFTITTESRCTFYFNNSYDNGYVSLYLLDGGTQNNIVEMDSHYIEVEDFYTEEFSPGKYSLVMHLENVSSKYDTFTVAMDKISTSMAMEEGTTLTSQLSTNNILTTNVFTPETTGEYNLACSRSDASVSAVSEAGSIIGTDPGNGFMLTAGAQYGIYFVTNGTSGTIKYSATYLSPISTLSSLGFSAGDLSPDWGTDPNNEYTLLVDPDERSSLTFNPVPDAPGGKMLINGVASSSLTIPVTAGMASQNVTIDYTSADEKNTSTYKVFVRAKSVECSLTGISPTFTLVANGRVATATVPNDITSLLIDGVTVSDYATWEALGSDGETPLDSNTMTLAEGLNSAYIRVTSENGGHTRVYPLYVYRASDSTEPAILAYDSEYKEVGSGIFTNLNLYVFPLGTPDVSAVVTKDGNSIDWSDPFTAEGYYEINAFSDNELGAGPFQFTIDKTAPVLTVVDGQGAPVANGALLKNTVTVSATDATTVKLTGTKDGTDYECPDDGIFTESGTYAVAATDAAGNSTPYAFTIDVSAPNIRAVCGTNTLADGGHANGTVVVTVTDPHYKSKSVKKNGYALSWPSGGKFTYAGVYDVTAYDTLGNKATFRFTIDKTKPVITAKYAGRYTLYSNSYTKYDVTVKVSDTYLASVAVTRNGDTIPWLSGMVLSDEGVYVFTATDLAGNTTRFTFTIDKTKPVIKALSGETELSTGANVNTNVTVSVSDTNLYGKYVKKNGYSVRWPSAGTFTSSGKYYVTAKDKAGNISTFSFVIDKVKPVISVKTTYGYTVYSGRTTKYDVYVKVSDSYLLSKTATRNGEIIEWPSTNKFTVEGVYKVNATDKAGNAATEYTFTIYKPARFTVTEHFSGDPVANNGYASEAVTISFYEPFYASKTLTKAGTTEAIPWPDDPKEITVSDEGVYTATVRDTYGSVSVFRFTIDTAYPVITVKTSSSVTPMSDNFFTDATSVTVNVTDNYLASKAAARDGRRISWPSYGRFTYEGSYLITALDKAGNKSEFRFIIDRSKPVITCKTVTSQTKIANGATVSDSVVITITDRLRYSMLLTKDGTETDLSESDTITEDGIYIITATDSLGYSSTFTFTIHKTV